MEKVIFIDIPKCATTSILVALQDFIKPKKNIVLLNPEYGKGLARHVNLKSYAEFNHHINATIFTCIRNPYDRMVSLYKYYKKIGANPNPDDPHELKASEYIQEKDTFSKFVYDCHQQNQRLPLRTRDCMSHMDIITSGHDAYYKLNKFPYSDVFLKNMTMMCFGPKINYILKYESLDQDWQDLCKKLDWPHKPLRKTNVSKNNDSWETFYNDHDLNMVSEIFKSDFKKFGYKMK